LDSDRRESFRKDPRMKCFTLLSLPALLVAALFLTGADDKEAKCPVSGHAAKKDISLNVNGKMVYFCCDKCPDAYKKQINLSTEECTKCPQSGKAAKKENSIIEKTAEYVSFCCNNCPKAFAEKNKFDTKDEGPKTCPMSGKPAKDEKGTTLVVNGKKVYFCCANCPKGYLKSLGLTDAIPAAKCPMSGKEAKAETAQILVKSKTLSFCCADCPKEYAEKHFKDGVAVPADKK
jgi:uncharacterized pyridoxamine 5'-phosphate oxidase family protein